MKDSEIEQLIERARSYPLIGEVGLDFSNAHAQYAARQIRVFERLVSACSANKVEGRLLSIHAVQSASNVLDILEANGTCQQANVIFHWFSGTSEDLTRARKLGCYFSINERMLQSRRGRAYAAQIEEECLLLETDFPSNQAACARHDRYALLSTRPSKSLRSYAKQTPRRWASSSPKPARGSLPAQPPSDKAAAR